VGAIQAAFPWSHPRVRDAVVGTTMGGGVAPQSSLVDWVKGTVMVHLMEVAMMDTGDVMAT